VTTWDAAIDKIATQFQHIDQYGRDSVAFYVSGQLLTEDYYVVNKFVKGYLGTANIDTNSRLMHVFSSCCA
jgi:assimilatory nitrate reductase catalytic subunit